jgi:hypothetical protein
VWAALPVSVHCAHHLITTRRGSIGIKARSIDNAASPAHLTASLKRDCFMNIRASFRRALAALNVAMLAAPALAQTPRPSCNPQNIDACTRTINSAKATKTDKIYAHVVRGVGYLSKNDDLSMREFRSAIDLNPLPSKGAILLFILGWRITT